MQDDKGLITVHIPLNSGKRATRVMLPGDCVLVDAQPGGLQRRQYARTGNKPPKPVITMTFRLVELYDEPVERLFRIAHPWDVEDMGLEAGNGRCLGTIAVIDNPITSEPEWEVIEMQRHDIGTRVSGIKAMRVIRGLNRLVFKGVVVVRVNGMGKIATGWELRYQTRRRNGGSVGWAFIGTQDDEDNKRVPASLVYWRPLRGDLRVWLSQNLHECANV